MVHIKLALAIASYATFPGIPIVRYSVIILVLTQDNGRPAASSGQAYRAIYSVACPYGRRVRI